MGLSDPPLTVLPENPPTVADIGSGPRAALHATRAVMTGPERNPSVADFVDYSATRNGWLVADPSLASNVRGAIYKSLTVDQIRASHERDPESRLTMLRDEQGACIGCARLTLRSAEYFTNTYRCGIPGTTSADATALEVILYVVDKHRVGERVEVDGRVGKSSHVLLENALRYAEHRGAAYIFGEVSERPVPNHASIHLLTNVLGASRLDSATVAAVNLGERGIVHFGVYGRVLA